MKMRDGRYAALFACALLISMSVLAGCAKKEAVPEAPVESAEQEVQPEEVPEEVPARIGTLILKVNPEIAVEYDGDGNVVGIRGLNEDGRRIVEGCQDYAGRSCQEVVEELIGLINEAGYFVEETEGEDRRITIEIERGSAIPETDFLDKIAVSVQDCVAAMQMESSLVKSETTDSEQASYEIVIPSAFAGNGEDTDDASYTNDEDLYGDDGYETPYTEDEYYDEYNAYYGDEYDGHDDYYDDGYDDYYDDDYYDDGDSHEDH